MTTTRKGWASLSSFAPRYVGPDGTVFVIRSYEDIDRWMASWGGSEVAGNAPETKGQVGKPQPVDPEIKARQAEALAYVRSYTGTFGLILDIKADPRMGTKYMRLSERQVEVILAARDRDIARAEAASIARELYADEEYRRAITPRPEAAGLAPQRPTPAPVGSPVTEGLYRRGDVIFKVQKAVHGSGHLYAKQLVVGDGAPRWDYAPGQLRSLTTADRLTIEEAEAFGKLYGVCAVCGRILTDETSIARGIGPVCAGKL